VPATRPAWAEVLSFFLQICLVVGIELSDDITRGIIVPRPPGPALANAATLVGFEQDHGLWVEPAIQHYFEHPHQLLLFTLDWGRVVPVVNAVYGIAHGLVTLIFAIWIFWWKPRLFPFLRNVFLFATLLSVIGYNVFPVAPPRLAGGVPYDGGTYHFIDTVFVGRGVNLSFDQYAAMPSLHVAWALIVGLSMAWLVRSLVARILWLAYPLLMSLVVIVTANHYIMDCFGALVVVVAGFALALAASRLAPNVANVGGRRIDP
jgi:membrane-associated phospholipid phosphatase